MPRATEAQESESGTAVCLHCLRPLPLPGHFCDHCGGPNSVIAAMAPLEQVYSYGWLVNCLLSRTPTRLAMIGTVLITLPSLAVMALLPVGFIVAPAESPGTLEVLSGLPGVIIAGAHILLLLRVARAYIRGSRTVSASGP